MKGNLASLKVNVRDFSRGFRSFFLTIINVLRVFHIIGKLSMGKACQNKNILAK
jgi:hypothetical protein